MRDRLLIVLLVGLLGGCAAAQEERVWRVTGQVASEALTGVDAVMQKFMEERGVSAGALAVTYKGRLMIARGYGWDKPDAEPVEPTALFRIASLSKPVTAVAILHLVEAGKLRLDEKIVEVLELTPPPGQTMDERLKQVTILHLLQHLGGWDRNEAFDPMFQDKRISKELRVKQPIGTADIIKFMTGQPLQTDPGSTYSYSNFGYCLLGRVIEKRSGLSYGDYVQKEILAPLGIKNVRLGHSKLADRAPGEVRYNTEGAAPYGAFNLENMDAHGGWLSSAVDLVRFAAALDDESACPVLSAESIQRMFALPENRVAADHKPGEVYYGCGWNVRDIDGGKRNTWHNGSLPGTFTFMARWNSGIDCVVLFNKREGGDFGQIDPLLGQTLHAIKDWPAVFLQP